MIAFIIVLICGCRHCFSIHPLRGGTSDAAVARNSFIWTWGITRNFTIYTYIVLYTKIRLIAAITQRTYRKQSALFVLLSAYYKIVNTAFVIRIRASEPTGYFYFVISCPFYHVLATMRYTGSPFYQGVYEHLGYFKLYKKKQFFQRLCLLITLKMT